MSYIGLGSLVIITAFATALLGPWMFAVLAAAIGFWFLVEKPLIAVGVLMAGSIAGQLVRISVAGGTIVISDLLLVSVILAWLFRKLVRKEDLFIPNVLIGPLLFLDCIMGLSLLWAAFALPLGEVVNGSLYFFRFLAYQVIFFFVQSSVQNRHQVRQIFTMMMGTGALLAVLGFFQLVVFSDFSFMVPEGWDPHVGRLLSTWFDPNLLGGLFAALALLLLAQMVMGEKISFPVLFALAVLIAALLLTFSRSAYLAFVFGFFTIALLTIRRSWWLLAVGTAILVVSFLSSPRIQERVEGIFTVDVTAQKRIESWSKIIVLAGEHPIFGVGYNTLRYAQYDAGLIVDPNEHSAGGSDSSLLTMLATTGIVGFLIFIWLYGAAVFSSWKIFIDERYPQFSRGLGLGTIGALAALLVHSQFVNSLLYPHMLVFVWIILGLIVFSLHGKPSRV